MDYCDDVMKNERDMSPDPNGDSETTNAIAPDSGRFVYVESIFIQYIHRILIN